MKQRIFLSLIFLSSYLFSDWDAEFYQKHSNFQLEKAQKCIRQLNLQDGISILDVGCGDGRITAALAVFLPQAHIDGIDSSLSMIEKARSLLLETKISNLTFELSDAREFSSSFQYDYVLSFNALHWMNPPSKVVEKMANHLKKGGTLFLLFHGDHGRDRFDTFIKTAMEEETFAPYFSLFCSSYVKISPIEILTFFQKNSLLIKRLEVVPIDQIYHSLEDFKNWIRGWMMPTYLSYLPENLHESFLDCIVTHYLKKHPFDELGNFHYYDYWFEVEAEKS